MRETQEIEQPLPARFAGLMDQPTFVSLVSEIPRGERLWSDDCFGEQVYVALFWQILQKGNPLDGRLYEPKLEKPHRRLNRRQRHICWAFIRWFGSNCGRSALNTIQEKRSTSPIGAFRRCWDITTGRLWPWCQRIGDDSGFVSLDELLDETPGCSGWNPYPTDFARPWERPIASALFDWLDSIHGAEYLLATKQEIAAR